MTVKLDVPEAVAEALRAGGDDLSRQALEAWAVTAFRDGLISVDNVAAMLGLASRWKAIELLSQRKAYPRYTADELHEDIATSKRLKSS